ncbi:hypothetical protein [Streptomyces sp. NPDC048659]|uniref:hypothetical protein n=1 Tax=Streptomyces sp. NPDC048659 TaxID=3155489 RepID=UPI003411F7EB
MSGFMKAARDVIRARDGEAKGEDHALIAASFVEAATFEDPDVLYSSLRTLLEEDWMALPVWARNLAFRLACLQRPDDVELLKAAAADLAQFGPEWDEEVDQLVNRVDFLRDSS